MKAYTFFNKVCLVAALALLVACGSSKKAAKEPGSASLKREMQQLGTLVTHVNQQRPAVTGVRGKMNLRLALGTKSASLSGTLKMKRDEAIQLSLTAMGLIEVGRLEMTPQHLFVQDRIHKQYMQVKWTEVEAFQRTGINFDIFQALFWNELFVPGQSGTPEEKDFTLDLSAEQPRLRTSAKRPVQAQFTINTAQSRVGQTTVSAPERPDLTFDCQYRHWAELSQGCFPDEMDLNVSAKGRDISASIALSRVQADEQMGDLVTTPGSNYKQVSMGDILRILSNL